MSCPQPTAIQGQPVDISCNRCGVFMFIGDSDTQEILLEPLCEECSIQEGELYDKIAEGHSREDDED